MRPLPGDDYLLMRDIRINATRIYNQQGEEVVITDEQAMRDPIFQRLQRRMMMYPTQRSKDDEFFVAWFDEHKGASMGCTNHHVCEECKLCHSCESSDHLWGGTDMCPDCGLDKEICACDSSPDKAAEIKQAEAEFDRLISEASSPSLAALINRAIKTGAVKAKAQYTN